MLIDFFLHLKERRLPVSTTEYLTLLEALSSGLANCNFNDFYALSRLCLVKNEAHYDKFDVAFGEYFKKISARSGFHEDDITEDWLRAVASHVLSPEEMAMLDCPAVDGLLEVVRQLHDEEERPCDEDTSLMNGHGNSPLGHGDAFIEAMRLEGNAAGNHLATKQWDSRQFKGLNDDIELSARNIKMALRRLRKFAREGAHDELDLENTISSTARNAGWLDLKMRPVRHNNVKVLILFDFGGSMESFVRQCQELFSAVRTEFKQLEYFYFHNCIYDTVWRYDGPSFLVHYPLHQLMNKFGRDYKLIIVGDASMSPLEILDKDQTLYRYGTKYSGEVWLNSLLAHFRHAVWLNPESERFWPMAQSIQIIKGIMENRMYPLTLSGLDQAMKELNK